MNHTVKNIQSKQGASMIIALLLVAIISIVSTTAYKYLSTIVANTTQQENAQKAKFAAESAIEAGLAHALTLPVGSSVGSESSPVTTCITFNDDDATYTNIAAGAPCDGAVSGYWIVGGSTDIQENQNEERYIIPPPGQGTAGENCERLSNYSGGGYTKDILKPCNWNKLRFGETVSIPLFTDDGDPNTPNTADSTMNVFSLKVRTPCDDPMYDSDGFLKGDTANDGDVEETDWCTSTVLAGNGADGRPDIYDSDPGFDLFTDVIVHWQIVGECNFEPGSDNDGSCVAIPGEGGNLESRILNNIIDDWSNNPSYLYEVVGGSNISDPIWAAPPPFSNLPIIINLLTNPTGYILDGYNSLEILEPHINLTFVGETKRADDPTINIPYIEYQLETDVPIADSGYTVKGYGMYRNAIIYKKGRKENETSNIEFVIQN